MYASIALGHEFDSRYRNRAGGCIPQSGRHGEFDRLFSFSVRKVQETVTKGAQMMHPLYLGSPD